MRADLIHVFHLHLVVLLISSFNELCALRLLELSVPALADPREELVLGCRFDMGKEDLYSVKWYKDEQEFFRYTPRQQPHIMSFPVAGVHLVPSTAGAGDCGVDRCSVRLARLSTAHSGGSYRCEISTEAPTFRVVFEAANVTVAAVGRTDPQVTGFRSEYSPGDLVGADCTSAPADPAPIVSWLLNGQPAPAAAMGSPRTSRPDVGGLVTRSVALRFHVERRHFRAPHFVMELQCVAAAPPGVPAPPKLTSVTAQLSRDAQDQRHVLGNQKLEWLSNNVATQLQHQWFIIAASLSTLCWR